MSQFTIDDLKRIMRECAGEEEGAGLDGDIGEVPFEQLGYDSLALLETAARVGRELRVSLPDDLVAEVDTPAAFVAFVNGRFLAQTH
ncbi:acyl carrier protein [Micromonospora sp. NPDC050980]|uniref:acyl carrier protein n=1 Tax=Micromonospora sp. NPDC050980 TaxID=3155161 RepID=UPI003406DDC1